MNYLKRTTNQVIAIIASVILIFGLGSCEQEVEQQEDRTIRMVYANWSEGVAMTHLTAEILEQHLGYTVDLKMTDVESVFKHLSQGEYDVFVDAWLPVTHNAYLEQYGNELDDLGINVEKVQTGLVVPDYVNINTISELDAVADTIYGIGAGAGVMEGTKQAIKVYNLSAHLKTGNEQSMTTKLMEAVKRREPVVITGWTPHWMSNRLNLKFLEDSQNVYGDSEQIHTIARDEFTNDHPYAALFFERFELNEKQLGSLMDELQAFPNNERRAVRNWMDENEILINKWIRGLEPQREKIM
ncbi:MAG: glycine betaine ABC transporter substrate-binding protein [Gracilimonas sp.]|nr:glycine betaine ABC transporter substrate-binding protein [Gracilimonas sp.]